MTLRAWFAQTVPTALALALLLSAAPALGQLPSTEERLKILIEPERMKKKRENEKTRPPLEFFRSQVAPFDILPYVKPNHWITLSAELRANSDDYQGWLQTAPVPLLGMPHEVIHRRDARLLKSQRSRLSLQVMLPRVPKEFRVELLRPDSFRADELWEASLKILEPHQMLVLVRTKESNDPYARWSKLQAFNPATLDRADVIAVEKQRYYRLVLPLDPDKPLVSPHPLAWTPISHVIWDGMPPDRLNVAQRQALIDWLHWGGQLILIGGAGASFELLRDSFLNPYLPAEPSGENALLTAADLDPLADSYPPPVVSTGDHDVLSAEGFRTLVKRYGAKEPIRPAPNRPVFVAGLRPVRPGASSIPLGEGSPHLLGIEERVGRGRILMLAVNPTDPALAGWPGLDTLVRRVILRRPEEPKVANAAINGQGFHFPRYAALAGPDLSWVRYLSRDLGATGPRPAPYQPTTETSENPDLPMSRAWKSAVEGEEQAAASSPPVAEWLDSTGMPKLSRELLEKASGIKIPGASFVLKVILAYLIALVPLNWLICRYLLGRREWAWAVVPALALGFAVGVERAAAYDVGYNSACDEIDLIEIYGGYPRAHVSRFASLYSSGRVRFTISYPNDPTALALPMDTGHFLQGEDIATSVWRSYPVPALEGFQVQPRSLGMFRAEQMASLSGSIVLETEGGPPRIINTTDLPLRDAVVIALGGPDEREETYLGTIGPGATVEVKAAPVPEGETPRATFDPKPLLQELRAYQEDRPENSGEIRLVAWSPQPLGGQDVEPAVDRHRGLTAVVVHLKSGPPPSPDSATYNLASKAGDQDVIETRLPDSAPSVRGRASLPPGGRVRGNMTTPPPTTPGVPYPARSRAPMPSTLRPRASMPRLETDRS